MIYGPDWAEELKREVVSRPLIIAEMVKSGILGLRVHDATMEW